MLYDNFEYWVKIKEKRLGNLVTGADVYNGNAIGKLFLQCICSPPGLHREGKEGQDVECSPAYQWLKAIALQCVWDDT